MFNDVKGRFERKNDVGMMPNDVEGQKNALD
jgi:hypothetical protein